MKTNEKIQLLKTLVKDYQLARSRSNESDLPLVETHNSTIVISGLSTEAKEALEEHILSWISVLDATEKSNAAIRAAELKQQIDNITL